MKPLMFVTVLYSTACVGSSSLGLADFNKATGGVTAYVAASQVQSNAFELSVELRSGACPQIGDDVTASFNGQPMQVTGRGGSATAIMPGEDNYCGVPSFSWPVVDPSATTNVARLAPGASPTTSTIVLRDNTATWTIETPDLFANDFVIDPDQPHRIIWQSATRIWEDASFVECWPDGSCDSFDHYSGLAIADNVITGPTSDALRPVTTVYASADFDAISCDGPENCNIEVYDASHTF